MLGFIVAMIALAVVYTLMPPDQRSLQTFLLAVVALAIVCSIHMAFIKRRKHNKKK